MSMRLPSAILLGSALTAACRPTPREGDAPRTSAFPAVGLAVRDTAHAWCAAFPHDARAPALGDPVTIVVAGTRDDVALHAIAAARRSAPCPAAFAQPRWAAYVAYDLELPDARRSAAADAPMVALAVAGAARWVRGSDGVARGDVDGDGVPEELRRCAADEGEHFTLWSRTGPGGWRRRAHEYYDWGAQVDPTCRPGEDGRDDATSADAG